MSTPKASRYPTSEFTNERTARYRRAETMEMALKIHGGTKEAAEIGRHHFISMCA